jgi:hypothetical protein
LALKWAWWVYCVSIVLIVRGYLIEKMGGTSMLQYMWNAVKVRVFGP